MRLKQQVILLLSILIGLLLLVSVLSFTANSRTNHALAEVADWYVPINQQIAEATKFQLFSSLALQTVLNSEDFEAITAAEARFADTNQRVDQGLAAVARNITEAVEAMDDPRVSDFFQDLAADVRAARAAFEGFQSNALGLIDSLGSGDLGGAFAQMEASQVQEAQMLERLDSADQAIAAFTANTAEQARSDAAGNLRMLVLLAAVAVLISIAVGLFGLRGLMSRLGRDPAEIQALGSAIADGKLDQGGEAANEQGIYASLLLMRDQLRQRIEAEREQAEANTRIKVALDNTSVNIMVADADHQIIYLNKALSRNFQQYGKAIQRDLPSFDPDDLIGHSIHQFHKDPAHIRRILDQLQDEPHVGTIRIGGRTYRLSVAAVLAETGEKLGFVVEWDDRTAEVAIESEVDSVVSRASGGDFSRQVSTEGKDGFYLKLAEGLNRLIESTESAIQDTARVLSALARGDLSQTIETEYQGLFAELKRDANATTEKLRSVIAKIQEGAESVRTGSEEISQGNQSLSSRTEQQAASLEETAASMEQMTSTVRQSADNARHANQLAISASEKAETGGSVVKRAVTAMTEINDSSRRIADITSVIDSIAFQTNLLALNAAVEAARAGEQGRGFAVVASEVRTLAQRSATAAREIKELIDASVGKIETGSQLVNQSGETLSEIVEAVKKVTDMIAEIAAAGEEQTQGIEEVNRAITQMDEMTQQNAALVEQAAAASQGMGQQARELSSLVGFFSGVPTAGTGKPVAAAGQASQVVDQQPAKLESTGVANRRPRQDQASVREEQPGAVSPLTAGKASAAASDEDWDEF